MIYQRLLIRLWSLPLLRKRRHSFLARRVWKVEGGPGARLKLKFPQNRDFLSGATELPVQREIASRLRPGDVFYDIGANVGFFSLIAARLVGTSGSVCAFEPYPPNAASVRENAKLNEFVNIRLSEVALGRESRIDELLMTAWDGGGALSMYGRPEASVDRVKVQVWSLDEFIAAGQLPPPTFVKIDVEGAEMEVIQGMSKTIVRHKPILLYEIDDADRETFQRRWTELDTVVEEFGYSVLHLKDAYPALNWNVGHSLSLPRVPPKR